MEAEAETKVVDARPKPSRPSASLAGESMPRDRLVGRYELLHRLGHGGMATVYLGRAIGTAGFEKLVAVKVIHPHLANEPDFVEMFLDEARIAARIRHPHVVEILDLGREDDVFFMVMEYVEGDTLSSLLKELRKAGELLPVSVVLQVVADACEGLAAAHDLVDPDGVPYHLVHRDVSPHNLLAGTDGRVRVVDFGIMKAAGKRSTTLTGQLRGKLPYMSPEQARGKPIDRRTDLFALGAVMWELLTNERLLAGETESEILARACDFELPEIEEHRKDLSPEVMRVLRRALSADRESRYADAHEMLRDVRTALRSLVDEDPRDALARIMKRYFAGRLDYVRAAARNRGIDRQQERDRRSSVLSLDEVASKAAAAVSASRQPTAVIDPAAKEPLREFPEVPTAVTSTPVSSTGTTGAPPKASRSWSLLIGLPLVGAAVGTAIVSYAQRGRDDTPLSVVAEPAESPAGTTAAEEPTAVKWVFNTEPQGASVTIGQQRFTQVTPMTVEMPRSDEPVAVRLEREGFEAVDLALAPWEPQNFSLRLVPLDRPTPAVTPVTNTNLRFTARQKKPKKPQGDAPEATGGPTPAPTSTPPPEDPKGSDDGRTLAEMPSLKGPRPRPGG
ncbi:MAG: serine/threonine-protein kinase [Nannocystaceae bacterium]